MSEGDQPAARSTRMRVSVEKSGKACLLLHCKSMANRQRLAATLQHPVVQLTYAFASEHLRLSLIYSLFGMLLCILPALHASHACPSMSSSVLTEEKYHIRSFKCDFHKSSSIV